VRILSDGDSGDVEQSNSNESGDAWAVNKNDTTQSNEQSQSGTGGDAWTGDATGGSGGGSGDWKSDCGCGSKQGGGGGDADSGAAYGGDVTQSQTASNSNTTDQTAEAKSEAVQVAPRNTSGGLEHRKGTHGKPCGCGDREPKGCGCHDWKPKGCGCDSNHGRGGPSGDVEQSNSNASGDAFAVNTNGTTQSNVESQDATGGDASTGDAVGGNGAAQHADHRGWKDGCGCESRSKDDRGGGDARSGDAYGGDVDQSQDASNRNDTTQDANAKSTAKYLSFAPKGR